jgi:hypothetical protein
MEKQRENVSKRYHRSFDRRILAQKYPVTFVSYEKKTDERGK